MGNAPSSVMDSLVEGSNCTCDRSESEPLEELDKVVGCVRNGSRSLTALAF